MRIRYIPALLMPVLLCCGLCAQEPDTQIDLDRAVVIAISNSPVLESSRLGVEMAKYELNKVKKATNPTVSASGGYVRLGPVTKNGDGQALSPDEKGNVSGTVSMPIDVTGSFRKAVKAQTASYDASRYSFESGLSTLIYNVKASFFNVLSLQGVLPLVLAVQLV